MTIKRTIFWSVALGCVLACHTLFAARVAVFSEDGFPSHSSRTPQWHAGLLKEAGHEATLLTLRELQEREAGLDAIILPHGGCVPSEASATLGRHLNRGGTVVICGEIQQDVGLPAPLSAELSELAKLREDGDGERLGEFLDQHGSGQTGILRRHPVSRAWISAGWQPGYNNNGNCRSHVLFQELGLQAWPNMAQWYRPQYQRSHTEALTLHPLVRELGLGEYFPPSCSPATGKEPVRLQRYTPMGSGTDFSFGIFWSLFQFGEPSGTPYVAMPQKGLEAKDCESDFFVYRRHDQRRRGGTLIVLGKTGLQILESEAGAKMIQGLMLLAGKEFPGTPPVDYIDRVHELERLIGQCNQLYAEVAKGLAEATTVRHYQGNASSRDALHRQLKLLRRDFSLVNNLQERLNTARQAGQVLPSGELDGLRRQIGEVATRLAQSRKEMAADELEIAGPQVRDAKHRYRRLRWCSMSFLPWGEADIDALAAQVADLGVTEIDLYSHDWQRNSSLMGKYGLGAGYRFNYAYNGADMRVECGNFDPRSGTVTPAKISMYSDKKKVLERDRGWVLRRAAREPGITTLFHLEERDMQWSLWGDFMRGEFLAWLRATYGDVAALNRQWGSDYAGFEAVALPLKRPVSRTEHALWEDWTRFREVFRLEREVRPEIELVRQYAPEAMDWHYGSYNMQRNHPANGVNYYELGRMCDPACFESGEPVHQEILLNDIVAFGKKAVNTEWSAFYFPSDDPLTNLRRMKENLWNTVNCGTIGMYLYMGGNSVLRSNGSLINASGIVQPLGWQFKEVTRDLGRLQHIYLDGRRQEAPLQIVYSPTTRRHTSWPGIEMDKSLECVSGFYEASQRSHIQARGIDEQAIMEGLLPSACRVLVLPQVDYYHERLQRHLEAFVDGGGTLVATVDSGRYDSYGQRRDWLLEMAGVVPSPLPDARIGQLAFGSFPGTSWSLEAVLEDGVEVLRRYQDGSAAATRTRVGNGSVVILGFPFGREFFHQFRQRRLVPALRFWRELAADLGLEATYVCDDENLVVRPWEYAGEQYLMLNYKFRPRPPIRADGFPLATADALCPFELRLVGSHTVEDYLLGLEVPTTFADGYTVISGLIENPGGKVYRLTPAEGRNNPTAAPPQPEAKEPVSVRAEAEVPAAAEALPLPYDGKIFLADGKVKLGDFLLEADFVKDGQWQGRVFLTIMHEGRRVRREIVSGRRVRFRFPEKTLVLDCRAVFSAMPENVEGRFSVEPTTYAEGCSLRQEKFLGRDSWVLENRWIFARFVPELGGRLVELRSAADDLEHVRITPEAFAKAPGETYVDYGGMEVNPGNYQGPGWNVPHEVRVVSDSPERVEVEFVRSRPCSWSRGPTVSFAHRVSLSRDEAWLGMSATLFNEEQVAAPLKLRTHPVFAVAGDCNSDDGMFLPAGAGGVVHMPLRAGRSESYDNAGEWCAVLDGAARQGVYMAFAVAPVEKVYTWMGQDACNFELWFRELDTAPREGATFSWRLGLVQGLGAVSDFMVDRGLVSELTALDPYRVGAVQRFRAHITATRPQRGFVRGSIRRGETVLHTFEAREMELVPERSLQLDFQWECPPLADGECELRLEYAAAADFGGSVVSVLAFPTMQEARSAQEAQIRSWQARLDEWKAQEQRQPHADRRRRLIRGSLILSEMRLNLERQQNDRFDENLARIENLQ